MLKHLSSRSESRTAIDDISREDEQIHNQSNTDIDAHSSDSIQPKDKRSVDITNRLSKPEIKRIILRRKSDLIRKELNDLNKSISQENIAQDSMEVVEEIQQQNSTYLVHKRPKNPIDTVASDSSYEISNLEDSFSGDKQADEQSCQGDIVLASDPLSTSSPTNEKSFDIGRIVPELAVQGGIDELERKTDKNFSGTTTLTVEGSMENLEKKTGQTYYEISTSAVKESTDKLERKLDQTLSETQNIITGRGGNENLERKTGQIISRTSTFNSHTSHAGSSKYLNGEINSIKKNKTYLHLPAANDSLSRYSNRRSVSVMSSGSNISPDMRSQARSCTTDDGFSSYNEEIFMLPLIPNHKRKLKNCKYACVFFIALCIIACIVGGFLHFYLGQFPQDVTLNQGDIKFIETSTLFCSGIKARSDQSEVHLIAFDKNKDEASRILYSVSASFILHPLYIWKRGFYLLADSKVTINIQTNYLVKVMVFEGEKSLSLWTDRKYSEIYVTAELCCSNRYSRKGSISFTARNTNVYFLVLYSGVEVIPVNIASLELHFDRVTYTFTYYSSSCNANAGETCLLTQSFNSHESVAIEVPLQKNWDDIATMNTFRYECTARIWFYCLFFGGTSIAGTFLILTIYYLTARIMLWSTAACCKGDVKNERTCNSCYNDYRHKGKSIELQSYLSDSISRTRSIASAQMSEQLSTSSRRCSARTRRMNRGRYGSQISSVNHATKEIGITNDIAAIYREEEEYEGTDNGVLGGVSLNPGTYSEI